jgi:HAE1 family hydrophobic/amphiphilic exporter-1
MGLLSVVVIGGVAAARLPLAFLPTLDVPFIGIVVPYPNSNPTQVEKEIVKPVEEALATLSGVKRLRATATADSAEFELEFTWGHELDVVRMQVSEKMDLVKPTLPAGIGDVLIYSFNTADIPVMEGRIAAEGVDLSRNYDLLEARVVNRIRRVPGVARVDLNGVAPREIEINLILDRIKAHGVDVGALIDRLQGAVSTVVLGQVREGERRLTARAVGVFSSLEALRDLPVDDRGLRLSEIAEIAYDEPPIPFGRHLDRKYAVALDVFKESTANTVEVVRAVNRVIQEEVAADPLLKGVKLFVWQDQAKEITKALDGLLGSGAVGALLAVGILYYFLRRLDSTLIVSLSIPFSIVAACGVIYFAGGTLNILSMMGLMLGVGMLVDNAVVVLEAVDRKHRVEPDPKAAARIGAREVTMAVASSTLTTVIVFLPLIVGTGTELTAWLGEVGLAISVALLCSLVSSLTLIPLMASRLLRRRRTVPPRSVAWLEDRYAAALAWTLRHKVWTGVIVVASLGAGFVPLFTGLVETAPFAAGINRRLHLTYEFSDFVYKSDAERAVSRVEEYLFANKETFLVDSVYSYYTENDAGTAIVLARQDLGDREVKDLRKRIREGLPDVPGARIYFHEDADEGGSSTYFAVKFYGQDTGVLQRLAEEAERRLAGIEGVEDISTSLKKGRREIQVVVDRERARRAGLTAQDVADIFAFTLGGLRLRRFSAGDREVETWLHLRLEDRESLEDLRALEIRPRGGRPVRLGEIAGFQTVRRAQEIRREDRKVRVAVNATYEGEGWDRARSEIAAMMDAFDLPPGYSWSWDDRILEQGEEDAQMVVNFLLALVLVYIVMASLFESLAQPFAILFSIPFAVAGASWFLAATRTPFNIMAQIGLLILIGIVVNNGIVLLDHMNQLRRAGMARDEAIIAAGRDRLRAILMTASTTVVGLVPLAFGGAGIGGIYYFPLARTIMGGLISSTVLTLIVLPYICIGVEGAARWMGRVWAASAPTPA